MSVPCVWSRGCDTIPRPCFDPHTAGQENRLLHWTVTHPDDIARSNFLRGDHAHFFTNLDQVLVNKFCDCRRSETVGFGVKWTKFLPFLADVDRRIDAVYRFDDGRTAEAAPGKQRSKLSIDPHAYTSTLVSRTPLLFIISILSTLFHAAFVGGFRRVLCSTTSWS